MCAGRGPMIPQIKQAPEAAASATTPAGGGADDEEEAGAPSLASADSASLSRQETDLHDEGEEGAGAAEGGAAADAADSVRASASAQAAEVRALEEQQAQLRKEEQTLQQKTWKANKAERKLIDAKILSLQARIKGLAKKLDKARAVCDCSETDAFDQRLAARERGELDGASAQPVAQDEEDSSRIHVRGASLIFLEVDGVVSAMAGGIQDELLRRLRQVVHASKAELVVTSQWRRDPRLGRMLDAAMARLEMPKAAHITPCLTPQDKQALRATTHEHVRVCEVRKFLARCGGGGVCSVPWVVIDSADLASGSWLDGAPSTNAAAAPTSRNATSRRGGARDARKGVAAAEEPDEEEAKRRAQAEPFDDVHFVRVEGVHGLSPGLATRALNCLRFQAVSMVRSNNLILCSRGAQDAELAFAMGTHYRLGQNSPVACLRRDMVLPPSPRTLCPPFLPPFLWASSVPVCACRDVAAGDQEYATNQARERERERDRDKANRR